MWVGEGKYLKRWAEVEETSVIYSRKERGMKPKRNMLEGYNKMNEKQTIVNI